MKKISAILLLCALLLSTTACGSDKNEKDKNEKDKNDNTDNSVISEVSEGSDVSLDNSSDAVSDTSSDIPEEPVYVYETDNVKIEGLYVDTSYRDKDNSPLRLVYMFYTLTATDENLKIDSNYTKLTIGKNSYESEHIPKACKYMDSYYYSSYIENVYIGASLKVVATFKIPEGELTAGKTITISDTQMPNEENLLMLTDDIVSCDGIEAIAALADEEGYNNEMYLRQDADAATTQWVQSQVNGYYWWCYVNYTKYELEFASKNKFEVRTSLGTKQSGTYVVKNGYIVCTYSSTGYVIEVPYTKEDGQIKLDIASTFDVKEG